MLRDLHVFARVGNFHILTARHCIHSFEGHLIFPDFSYEHVCIFSFILEKCLRVRLLGHMVSINLLETAKCFPK